MRPSTVSQTVRPCLWRIKITHPAVPLLRLCWGTEQTLVCDESEGAAARAPFTAPPALHAFFDLIVLFLLFFPEQFMFWRLSVLLRVILLVNHLQPTQKYNTSSDKKPDEM